MHQKDPFGVSNVVSLLITSFFIGLALFLRDLYDEIVKDSLAHPPRRTLDFMIRPIWLGVLIRLSVRVSGSSIGSWLSALMVGYFNLDGGEWLAIGVGGAMGWKLVDSVQTIFFDRLAVMLKKAMKR
jgi:hypothetical protein